MAINVSKGLDAAIGLGAGLKLGIHFSYLDKMTFPVEQSIVANNQILPIADFNNVSNEPRLFSIKSELTDILQGTVLLVKDQLNKLIQLKKKAIEKGKEFAINVANNTAKVYGKINKYGTNLVIRNSDPATKSVLKSAFLEPRIINTYSSGRVINLKNKSGSLKDGTAKSRLYIVSNNINVSLLDSTDQIIDKFDTLTLSLSIDNSKLKALGLGESEEKLAKMYCYNADSMVWVELAGDANKSLDTVTTKISQSGSYAIGIELTPSTDVTPPKIEDYFPKEGASMDTVPNLWAKLYESPTGVGIDFSKTEIIVDGKVVDALWHPDDDVISYEPDTLTNGKHTFKVIATDYNGNTDSISSTFLFDTKTSVNYYKAKVKINCYPVPANNILNIDINLEGSAPISISIYNQMGQLVSSIFNCQPVNGHILVKWDRTERNHEKATHGIYFVKIQQNNNVYVKKVLLR